jgi:hypothetical protein
MWLFSPPLSTQDRCGRRIAAAHKIAGGFVANKHIRSWRDVELKPVPKAQVLGGSIKRLRENSYKNSISARSL